MVGRIFAYCRVSTLEQDASNQILAIRNAGYDILDVRVISETVSGSIQALKRKQFKLLVEHKLDRLGRDNIDVQQTIEKLTLRKIKVICLDLPIKDLSSSEGKLMLQMFSAFAEFERNRIRERTKEGLNRVKSEGKKLGRPTGAIKTTQKVQNCKLEGFSQSQSAKKLGLGIATIKRHWNK